MGFHLLDQRKQSIVRCSVKGTGNAPGAEAILTLQLTSDIVWERSRTARPLEGIRRF